jgi:hypothetical protein
MEPTEPAISASQSELISIPEHRKGVTFSSFVTIVDQRTKGNDSVLNFLYSIFLIPNFDIS